MTFSGYITSGFVVFDQVCFYNSTVCKLVRVYVVDTILADQWFYGIAGGFGIVGVGPGSPFVRQFTDPETNTQQYSIVVGRGVQQPTQATRLPSAQTAAPTNITFGPPNDPYYASLTSLLNLTSDPVTGTYYLS